MGRPKSGRPSIYKREYPTMIYQYVKKCKETDTLPFIQEFCSDNGLTVEIISRWAKITKVFNQAIEYLKQEQELMLVRNGMKRKYDPSMARFILAANHGYVETSKQINEGQQPVTIQVDMSGGYLPPKATTQPPKPLPAKVKHN